jgi:hypothetical protein
MVHRRRRRNGKVDPAQRDPSGACADDKEHKLDVRLAPSFGSKGQDYMVLSRSGYYCSPKGQVGGSPIQ